MLAARVLGAEGVQIGTRFALTAESSASKVFKDYCLHLEEGDTRLLLKKFAPVRLVRNNFRSAVEAAEAVGASEEELRILLGRGRAKRGIFEGDLEEGELEIGQDLPCRMERECSLCVVMKSWWRSSRRAWERMKELDFDDLRLLVSYNTNNIPRDFGDIPFLVPIYNLLSFGILVVSFAHFTGGGIMLRHCCW